MANILVVDDDTGAAESLQRNLRIHGHEVSTAASTAEAQERIAEEPFALVISDYNMPPGKNGVALAAWIAQNQNGLPVIINSGEGENFIASQNPHYGPLKQAGVIVEYVPRDHTKLMAAIEKNLSKKKLPDETIAHGKEGQTLA